MNGVQNELEKKRTRDTTFIICHYTKRANTKEVKQHAHTQHAANHVHRLSRRRRHRRVWCRVGPPAVRVVRAVRGVFGNHAVSSNLVVNDDDG